MYSPGWSARSIESSVWCIPGGFIHSMHFRWTAFLICCHDGIRVPRCAQFCLFLERLCVSSVSLRGEGLGYDEFVAFQIFHTLHVIEAIHALSHCGCRVIASIQGHFVRMHAFETAITLLRWISFARHAVVASVLILLSGWFLFRWWWRLYAFTPVNNVWIRLRGPHINIAHQRRIVHNIFVFVSVFVITFVVRYTWFILAFVRFSFEDTSFLPH